MAANKTWVHSKTNNMRQEVMVVQTPWKCRHILYLTEELAKWNPTSHRTTSTTDPNCNEEFRLLRDDKTEKVMDILIKNDMEPDHFWSNKQKNNIKGKFRLNIYLP